MTGARIVLAVVGSLGDLHPFLAVALKLAARGHSPVIAAAEEHRAKVEAAGLAFHPVRPSGERLRAESGLTEAEIIRRVARRSTYYIDRMLLPHLEESYADLWRATEGADLVVASSLAYAARLAAEARGLPLVSLLLSPCLFFSPYDPPRLKEVPWLPAATAALGPGVGKLTLGSMRTAAVVMNAPIARLRRRLGLPPQGGSEIIDGALQADAVMALYSPLLGDLPPDAPPGCEVVGFTFFDSEVGVTPELPSELARFLEAGPPPLVFTMGSLVVSVAERLYADSAAVARRLGRRAVLLVGPEAGRRVRALAADDVCVTAYAPHSLVFPHAEAIIHHGGTGTSGQALRAGRPQLVAPAMADQFDNAERLERLGVARRLDFRRYTAARATALLRELLGDPGVAWRAAGAAQTVARENGAAAAASRIAEVLARRTGQAA